MKLKTNKAARAAFSILFLTGMAMNPARAMEAQSRATASRAIFQVELEGDDLEPMAVMILDAANAKPPEILIARDPLLHALYLRMDPSAINTLQSQAESREGDFWISITQLNRAGLNVSFDDRSLEIRIAIPAMVKRTSTVSISGRSETEDQGVLSSPARFSSFMNINAGQTFQYGQAAPQTALLFGSDAQTRQPFRAELDGAANLDGWIIEGNSSVSEEAGDRFRRGEVRLIKDQPERMLRYSLGDIAYPVTGFQQSRPLLGASVSTNFNLQPGRVVTPISQTDILLRTKSNVRIWINGRLVQSLDLAPGRYDLRDFPISPGINDLTLEITDDVGRKEFIRIPYLYSDLLLDEGIHQLTYAIGLKTVLSNSMQRTYRADDPVLSVSHRAGFSKSFTFGGYSQIAQRQALLGLNSSHLTRAGTFTLEPAFARSSTEGTPLTGYGMRLGYLFTDYIGHTRSQRNIGFALEGRSSDFHTLDESSATLASSVARYDITASYSQRIFDETQINFTMRRGNQRESDAVGLSSSWRSRLDTSVTGTRLQDSAGLREYQLFFLFSWAFPERNQYATATYRTERNESRVEWNYSPAHLVGGLNASAALERSDDRSGVLGRLNYVGNRARLGLIQDSSQGIAGDSLHRTQLTGGAALVYADGQFAISRPVTESFVIVAPRQAFRGETLLLNPQQNLEGKTIYEARTDLLGAAVLPELASYRPYQLNLSIPDSVPGLSLPRENYLLRPTYKSGTSIVIISDASLQVLGRLRDQTGKPIPLLSGELHRLDTGEKSEEPKILFTNRLGEFSLEGMSAGRYRFEAFDQSTLFEFEVPSNAAITHRLGEITVEITHE